jgi:tRNA(Ile)-lysidine synthase
MVSAATQGFPPGALQTALESVPLPANYWVALSGGLDSSVLLHAMHALTPRLGAAVRAVHVNHGLSPLAGDWAKSCLEFCSGLAIPLETLTVDARPHPGQSPEAWARQLRYQALEKLLQPGDVLLTAHHQDDQAETLLLQLLRGAGPRGLAAMPRRAVFGPGWHLRPLLNFSREQLQVYGESHGLKWIEDHSNLDRRFDRNFLRHEVLPVLKRRWPRLGGTLSRAAAVQADTVELLEALALQDLTVVRGQDGATLSVSSLKTLDEPRQRNVIREWLRLAGLPAPSAVQLGHVLRDMLEADWDATPCVAWPGTELRRYRDSLYAMPPLPAHDPKLVLSWLPMDPMSLLIGTLSVQTVTGAGAKAALCRGKTLTIRFRRGGEHCQPVGRRHRHSLKHLFQEAGIPPWRRERIPLIYLDDQLVALAGLWICEPFGAGPGEEGWSFIWEGCV